MTTKDKKTGLMHYKVLAGVLAATLVFLAFAWKVTGAAWPAWADAAILPLAVVGLGAILFITDLDRRQRRRATGAGGAAEGDRARPVKSRDAGARRRGAETKRTFETGARGQDARQDAREAGAGTRRADPSFGARNMPALGPDGLPDDAGAMLQYCMENGIEWWLEPFVGLDDLPARVKANSDPALWLAVLEGMGVDEEPTIEAMHLMLRHPDCPATIAAAILRKAHAPLYFGTDALPPDVEGNDAFGLVKAVCERDAAEGFPAGDFGDPPWVNRAGLLQDITRKSLEAPAPVPPPFRLLSRSPMGPAPRRPYIGDEEGLSLLRWR